MVGFVWCGFGRMSSVASVKADGSQSIGNENKRFPDLSSSAPNPGQGSSHPRRSRSALRMALLGSVSALAIGAMVGLSDPAAAGQLPLSAFQTYDASSASSIVAGPFSLYQVPLSSLKPTQMNAGFAEVGKKMAGWDLPVSYTHLDVYKRQTQMNAGFAEVGKKMAGWDLLSPAALTPTLLTDIEPVVIGPGGVLYLTDGHHTFLSLLLSNYGASNPNVFVNVIANYSNLTPTQFWAKMQASNFLLPLNNGVVQSVDPTTGAPIPSSFLGMTSNVYRGLEYSILKNKNSVLFPTASNITGGAMTLNSKGASVPGLDKTAAFYSDFIWAQAYRSANPMTTQTGIVSLGLPYLSPGDIAIATQWNLNGNNTISLPGSTVTKVSQLPGYILPTGGSLTISTTISDATLANGVLAGDGTFTGLRGWQLGSVTIGSSAPGFIMQLGADLGSTVTLSGTNTYTGGTTILAGTLNITSAAALGAASPTGAVIDPNNIAASIYANNGIVFNSLSEGKGTLTINPTTTGTLASPFVFNRPIAVDGEVANLDPNRSVVQLTGEIISLGGGGTGIGNATGVSDLTIKDGSKQADGVVILAPTNGSNPYFYGNWIISAGTLQASSDAALGNTTGKSYTIGQIVLDGGTFKAGASFDSVRSLTLTGGSTFDTNGFTTSFGGTLTDVQRKLTITNSSASDGAVTFGSLNISGTNTTNATGATSTLALTGGAAGETVTLTNGIIRTDRSTLMIQPTTALGGLEKVLSIAAPPLVNGIAPAWAISNTSGANSYDFLTYGGSGYKATTYGANAVSASTGSTVVELTTDQTLSANASAYALKIDSARTLTLGGNTLTLGDGTNPAGLILGGSGSNVSGISGGTLAFGGSEGVIFIRSTSGSGNTISSTITGTNGLTIAGAGWLTLSAVSSGLSGPVNIDSGKLTLTAANALTNVSSVNLSNVKSSPAAAGLSMLSLIHI